MERYPCWPIEKNQEKSLFMAAAVFNRLYKGLPEKTWETAEKSFLVSAAAATLLALGRLGAGLEIAALAFGASLVDSLASAVFRSCFNRQELPWYAGYAKLAVSLVAVNYLGSFFLAGQIGVIFTLATYFFVDLGLQAVKQGGFQSRQLDRPTFFLNYRWSYLVSALIALFKLSEVRAFRFFLGLL
jgi:hypothetical protein